MAASAERQPRVLGRYALFDPIASGGMATVHFGRLIGPSGFARTVAIKRLHEQFARNPEFVSMFLDEARLAARIRHPNVVATLDVVALEGELFLVMDYVQGDSLVRLIKASRASGHLVPIPYASAIVAGALRGLHAAHEARDERGEPLGIVHRDVSPHNIMVGADGVARVLDFGVAKAVGRLQTTREGQLKGKMAYMAPEQLRGGVIDRRTDVYAAGVVLWESLTGRRLFPGESDVEVFGKVLEARVPPPSQYVPEARGPLDEIVMCALSSAPEARFATARDMARALEAAVPLVPPDEIGEWVEATAGADLAARTSTVERIESQSSFSSPLGSMLAAHAATVARDAAAAPPVSDPRGPLASGSSASGVSPVSTATPMPPARPGSRAVIAAAAVGGAVVISVVLLGVVWVMYRSLAAREPASVSAATTAVTAETAPSEPSAVAGQAAAPLSTARPSGADAPAASATTEPTPSAVPSAADGSERPTPPAHPAATTTAAPRASAEPSHVHAPSPAPARNPSNPLDRVLDSRK